jgi:O-antigen/teichoic acid export membrane protein
MEEWESATAAVPPAASHDAAAATTGSSVVAGSLWHVASRVVPQLYTLVVSVVAARSLGPDGMGRQSFIAFVELSLIMLMTGGPFVALMRYTGETVGRERPEALGVLVRWAWRVEGAGALLGAAVLVGAAIRGSDPRAGWALAGVACALGILQVVPSALLVGLQRWRDATIAGLVTGTFTTIATVVVLAAGGGIVGMFAVEAVGSAVILLFTALLARRALADTTTDALPSAPDAALLRGVWRYAGVSAVSVGLTFVVARRSELFFLDHYSTNAEIAVYSIVFAAVTALVYVPDALASTMTPAFATLYGAGQLDRIRDGFARALRLLLTAVMPMTAATIALGPLFLRLVYGSAYDETGSVLLAMVALIPLAPIFALGTALVEGVGRLRILVVTAGLGAAVDLGLAALVVPEHGAQGAALANVGGQVALGLPLLLYAARLVGGFPLAPVSLARAAIASTAAALAAAGCLHLLDGWDALVVGLGAGTAVLAVLAVVLRVLSAEDGSWLDGLVGSRIPSLGRFVRATTAGAR